MSKEEHYGTVIVLRRTTFLAVVFLEIQELAKEDGIYNGYAKALASVSQSLLGSNEPQGVWLQKSHVVPRDQALEAEPLTHCCPIDWA
jgi:hypothetical protein